MRAVLCPRRARPQQPLPAVRRKRRLEAFARRALSGLALLLGALARLLLLTLQIAQVRLRACVRARTVSQPSCNPPKSRRGKEWEGGKAAGKGGSEGRGREGCQCRQQKGKTRLEWRAAGATTMPP
eukprot:362707-Chlamydomonas_euryale.AAC.1